MGLTDGCRQRLAAARPPMGIPLRTAAAAAIASSTLAAGRAALTSATEVGTAAARPAAQLAEKAAVRLAAGAVKAVSAFQFAARLASAAPRGEGGSAARAGLQAAAPKTRVARPAGPCSAFVCCCRSCLSAAPSVAASDVCCFSSLCRPFVGSSLRPRHAADSTSPPTPAWTSGGSWSISTTGFVTAAAAPGLGAAAARVATSICNAYLSARHKAVHSPPLRSTTAAVESPRGFLQAAAAGKVEAAYGDRCLPSGTKETTADSAACEFFVAERAREAAERERSMPSAAIREQLSSNKSLASFAVHITKQTTNSPSMLPTRSAAAWPFISTVFPVDARIARPRTAFSHSRNSSEKQTNKRASKAPESNEAPVRSLHSADECSSSSNNSNSTVTDGLRNELVSGLKSSSDGLSRRYWRSYRTSTSKILEEKKESSHCSSVTSVERGPDPSAAACEVSYKVEIGDPVSPCPQSSFSLSLPSAFSAAARVAVSFGSRVAACTAAFTAVPQNSSVRGAGTVTPALVVPPGAVACRVAAAVSPDKIDSSSSRGSWKRFILTSLAAFLAAASEAQRRNGVAVCEATSPLPSSTNNSSGSSSNSASSPSPGLFSIVGAWLPFRQFRLKQADTGQPWTELQQAQQQQAVLQGQPQQQDVLQLPQKQHLSFSEERPKFSPDNKSSPVVTQEGSLSSSYSSAGRKAVGAEGPHLCWSGGAVGSCAEAANAPLEDRSFAIVLPLDVSSEASLPSSVAHSGPMDRSSSGGVSSSVYGSTPLDISASSEPQAMQELLAKAARVFPEEIRRRQQKDDSWRSLRLPPSPVADAASASPSSLYPPPTAAVKSEPGVSRAVQRGIDGSATREALLEGSSNACLLAAVIDGHGGPQVAEFVKQRLPQYVHRELLRAAEAAGLPRDGSSVDAHLTDSALETAVTQAFRSLDDEIFDSVRAAYALSLTRSIRVGACCTAILLVGDKLLVANSGDCKAVLSRRSGSQILALNEQLNANSPAERQRLREAHPGEENVVLCKHSWEEHRKPSSPIEFPLYYAGLLGKTTQYSACYVKGRLQPTRAFGDFLLKKPEYAHEMYQRSSRRGRSNKSDTDEQQQLSYPYLTVDPVVSTSELRGDEDFIVLGSDGVWDFLSDADVNRIVHASLDRTKQRATLNKAKEQPASPELAPRVRATGEKEDTAVNAVDAAGTAAQEIVRAVLQKAAHEHNMTAAEMKACDPKRRRQLYDDVTAVVVLLGSEWKGCGVRAPRS